MRKVLFGLFGIAVFYGLIAFATVERLPSAASTNVPADPFADMQMWGLVGILAAIFMLFLITRRK